MSEDLKRRVKEALERTDIMALSTIGADGPWTAPVQYRYNEKLDLFFLSMPDAKHVRHILSDPRVSAAIYSHPGPPGGNLGLQISGTAEHLTGESSASGWQSFKIKPREIWCFDSRVFGRERRQVVISDLRLLLPTAWGPAQARISPRQLLGRDRRLLDPALAQVVAVGAG